MQLIRRSARAMLALAASSAWAQGILKIGEINSYKVQPEFLEPYKKGMDRSMRPAVSPEKRWN